MPPAGARAHNGPVTIPTFREVQDEITSMLRQQGYLAAILVDLSPLAHIEKTFGGAAFLSTDRRLFYGYIVPMLALTLVGATGMPGRSGLILASLTLALAFATLAFAHNVHAMIQRSLVLRFENMDLIDALQQQKDQADYANLSKSRFLAAMHRRTAGSLSNSVRDSSISSGTGEPSLSSAVALRE